MNSYRYTLLIAMIMTGCSTTQVVPEVAALPDVPDYVKTPHPMGYELTDLNALFLSPLSPTRQDSDFVKGCADELLELNTKTSLMNERQQGAIELVEKDPERHHWCFYSKVKELQDLLQTPSSWSERQRKVLSTYEYLTPMANAFMVTYRDSRYLRWASYYYMKISEYVFFRRVRPTPDSTLTLVKAERTDLEPWVQTQSSSTADSVFAKYGLSLAPVSAMVTESSLGNPAPVESFPSATSAETTLKEPNRIPAEKSVKPDTPTEQTDELDLDPAPPSEKP